MRYFKLLIWVLVGIILVIFALGNNQAVQVYLLPSTFTNALVSRSIFSLPLFIVVYLALLIGVIFGFFFEYFREYKYRSNLRKNKKELSSLRAELQELKSKAIKADLETLSNLDKG